MKKLYGKFIALVLCVVCALTLFACSGMKEVTYAEFQAKATEASARYAGYTGGTIKYRCATTYYGLMEYEGGFVIVNGEVTLTDPENGNEDGRDSAVWVIENERAWKVERKDLATYKIGKGFRIEDGSFIYEFDENGYFIKETNTNFSEENWIIEITWS